MAEQVFHVAVDQKIAGRLERRQKAFQADADIDRFGAKRLHRLGNQLNKIGSTALRELELRPAMREHTGQDGSARDTGDAVELAQQPGIVEPPQRAQPEQRGAVASARQGQSRSLFIDGHRHTPRS